LNGFRDVLALDLRIRFKISNRPGHLQYAIMGAGAQSLLLHGSFQHALTVRAQLTISPNLACAHLSVAVNTFSGGGKAIELDFACADNTFPNLG
jgi:hypothetical protein